MAITIPGMYFSGTTTAGSDQSFKICQVVEQCLLTFENANGDNPWSILQDNTGAGGIFSANYDKIWMTKGDISEFEQGDTRAYVRIRWSNSSGGWRTEAYQDWSAVSTDGFQTVTSAMNMTDGTSAITWYASVNEYEFTMFFHQTSSPTTWRVVSFGQPSRTHVPLRHRGRCFSTAAIAAGTDVVIPVDRDMTESLRVGGLVWLMDLTPDGEALTAVYNPEVCTITAIDNDSITVDEVVQASHLHMLIGEDPQPTYSMTNLATGAQFVVNVDDFGTADSYPARAASDDSNEGAKDPASIGYWYGTRVVFMRTAAPEGVRGTTHHLALWTFGSQTQTDRFRHNYDSRRLWVPSGAVNGSLVYCLETGGV